MNRYKKSVGLALTAAVVMTAAGCDEFLTVRNPNVVEAGTIDPVLDSPVLSRSAFQNFAQVFSTANVYMAWFTHGAWVGDTFPTRNEFGRRNLDDRNGTLNSELWAPLSRAVASAEDVLRLAGEAAGAEQSVDIARAALTSGYSMIYMAEMFCRGTVQVGPELNTQQMLDMAIERLDRAITVGTAASTATGTGHTAATRAEGGRIANAARVGIARAHLQADRLQQAIDAATPVDEDFVFNVVYVDQAGARGRLGNTVFAFSAGGNREALVVSPTYRAMGRNVGAGAETGDPRIPYADAGRLAQDGELRLWTQRKFTSWADPIRLASGLEARYIIAEARLKQNNPADALALIAERRTAGEQEAFAGGTDDEILRELMDQKSRDFWLEGQRMGDFRRNPGAVPNVLGPTDPYYKPAVGQMADDTCLPLPAAEWERNPNLGER